MKGLVVKEFKDIRRRNALIAAISLGAVYIAAALFLWFDAPTDSTPEPVSQPPEATEQAQVEEPIQEDFENEKIEQALLDHAHVIEDCLITYYCCEQYPHICNAGHPYKTATGNYPVPYMSCAVDPSVIPYGSDVLVDFGDGEIHYYVATDTGGSIGGHHIDLVVATHDEALELGRDYATVYWIEPGGVQE